MHPNIAVLPVFIHGQGDSHGGVQEMGEVVFEHDEHSFGDGMNNWGRAYFVQKLNKSNTSPMFIEQIKHVPDVQKLNKISPSPNVQKPVPKCSKGGFCVLHSNGGVQHTHSRSGCVERMYELRNKRGRILTPPKILSAGTPEKMFKLRRSRPSLNICAPKPHQRCGPRLDPRPRWFLCVPVLGVFTNSLIECPRTRRRLFRRRSNENFERDVA